MFESVETLPTHAITGGVLLNQKVTPQMLMRDADRRKLVMLLRAFFNRREQGHPRRHHRPHRADAVS